MALNELDRATIIEAIRKIAEKLEEIKQELFSIFKDIQD